MIALSQVSKIYEDQGNRVAALVDVDLEIGNREFVTVMGPSGCGKTTLLHLIAGLDRSTSGRVRVDHVELESLNETELTRLRQKKIGVIFQFFNLLPSLNVMENVILPVVLQGTEDKGTKRKAQELLESIGLGNRLFQSVSKLSGGEQQRVAIVRSLMTHPDILLADEPTGNLDSDSGDQVIKLLLDVAREREVTVVLVTHSPEIARVGSRMLRMKDGRVIEDNRANRVG